MVFSSDDATARSENPEEDAQIELPSDPLPEKPLTKQRKKPYKHTSLIGRGGRPKVLSFPERVEAWHKYTLGSSISDLAVDFQTNITEIQKAINSAAQELGYPHNHIDPELERFKIVTASDQMKSAQVKLLQDSNQTLRSIKDQQAVLKAQREEIGISSETSPDEMKLLQAIMNAEGALELRRQSEIKTVVSLMAEYRATNLVIADLTGIKKTKPVRKPKQVRSIEDDLEGLDIELLTELAKDE